MRATRRRSGQRLAKALVIALTFICLVFLLHVAPHGHANSQEEAACLLCQAAHVSATPAPSSFVPCVALVPIGEVAPAVIPLTIESFIRHSDPRGPPVEGQV
jgi:hypothetical protein